MSRKIEEWDRVKCSTNGREVKMINWPKSEEIDIHTQWRPGPPANGPLKFLPKGPLFDENGAPGIRFPHSEK